MLEKMPAKTNKKNLLNLLIFSFIFFVILAPEIYANGDETTPPEDFAIEPKDIIISEINGENVEIKGFSFDGQIGCLDVTNAEGIANLKYKSLVDMNIKTIKSKDRIITIDDNIESVLVEDSKITIIFNPILTPKTITFEIDGNTYSASAVKGFVISDTVFGQEIESIDYPYLTDWPVIGHVRIRVEEDKSLTLIEGTITINYDKKYEENPFKIKMVGESHVELITSKQDENIEKFDFTSVYGELINLQIGRFHDSKNCIEKNCISYVELKNEDGETFDKIKIDGWGVVSKQLNEENIYTIKFEGNDDGTGKVRMGTVDIDKIKNTEFNKNMIINYNDGFMQFRITKEIRTSPRLLISTFDKEKITDEFYITDWLIEQLGRIPNFIKKELVDVSDIIGRDIIELYEKYPEETLEIIEKTSAAKVKSSTKDFVLLGLLDEKVEKAKIANNVDETTDPWVIDLYLVTALIDQESKQNQYAVNLYETRFGLGQHGADSTSSTKHVFMEYANKYKSKYPQYYNLEGEKLKNALMNDAEFNIDVTVDYLYILKDNYGFTKKEAIMAYNVGPTKINDEVLPACKEYNKGQCPNIVEFINTEEGKEIMGNNLKVEEATPYTRRIYSLSTPKIEEKP